MQMTGECHARQSEASEVYGVSAKRRGFNAISRIPLISMETLSTIGILAVLLTAGIAVWGVISVLKAFRDED